MNSTTPYSKSSIIYEVDFENKAITVAQPLLSFSKEADFKELHLTVIVQDKNRRARIGVKCVEFSLIDQYRLANHTRIPAVLLKYRLPVEETNIRSAYRLPLSTKFIIKGKILYENLEYFSPKDFSIRDISLTGISIVIPKTRNVPNPISRIKVNEKIILGVILIDTGKDKPVGTLPIQSIVIRINDGYSENYILVGLQIMDLSQQHELILNKFIHDSQIYTLNRLSGKNL